MRVTSVDNADLSHAFRKALGSFATGVCVVMAASEGRMAGMTLNSFTSVSLEPPLVLVSLAHGTRTLEAVTASGRFAISILDRSQRQVALDFAERGVEFPQQHVHRGKHGLPTVVGAICELACDVHDVVTAGDHDVVVGLVRDFHASAGEPLVFHAGRFGGVDTDAPAPRSFVEFLDEGAAW